MRYAICNETFQGWNWEETCRFVGETGYDGIEIAPFTFGEDVRDLDAAVRRQIREAAARAGIQIVGAHWLLVSPKGLSVTDPDAGLRRRTSDYLVSLVDFCSDVGGRTMVFGSPAQRRIPDGDSRESAEERFMESVRPALDRAHGCGITICLEPLPPPEANYLLTLREAAGLIKKLDHPAAKTILDVKSASSEGTPIPELIREYAPLIAHVHANDANRRGPGFGGTDFGPILGALHQIGYSGYVSVEVFDYSPDPHTIARNSLEYMRRNAVASDQ